MFTSFRLTGGIFPPAALSWQKSLSNFSLSSFFCWGLQWDSLPPRLTSLWDILSGRGNSFLKTTLNISGEYAAFWCSKKDLWKFESGLQNNLLSLFKSYFIMILQLFMGLTFLPELRKRVRKIIGSVSYNEDYRFRNLYLHISLLNPILGSW